jgi:hypothetical protein
LRCRRQNSRAAGVVQNHPALRRTQRDKLNRTLPANDANQESLAILEEIGENGSVLRPQLDWRWEAALGRDSAQRAATNAQNFAILAPRAMPNRLRFAEITRSAARHINPFQMKLNAVGECQRMPIRGPEWMYRSLGAGQNAGLDAINWP